MKDCIALQSQGNGREIKRSEIDIDPDPVFGVESGIKLTLPGKQPRPFIAVKQIRVSFSEYASTATGSCVF